MVQWWSWAVKQRQVLAVEQRWAWIVADSETMAFLGRGAVKDLGHEAVADCGTMVDLGHGTMSDPEEPGAVADAGRAGTWAVSSLTAFMVVTGQAESPWGNVASFGGSAAGAATSGGTGADS
ncbi:hypothetical protein M9458_053903 [Cirrhinus mrigala]|uniref:Uncharacterized protein n=1 Tax=Cirrhinus mrigala TaxID=683832 RepID=A0ABD0MKX3_CIRMR